MSDVVGVILSLLVLMLICGVIVGFMKLLDYFQNE